LHHQKVRTLYDMKNAKTICGALVGLAFLASPLVHAQATRTWVSGVGDDANPCSRTAPCKTFAGAISKTAAGGEIDALDPGGFGAVTITKSITIDGGPGVAGVLVSGTNGIVVAAGSSDVVILRNLQINGILGNGTNAGSAGINGVKFTSGYVLEIEHCNIFGFNNYGIDVEPTSVGGGGTGPQVTVSDTIVSNNAAAGLYAAGSAPYIRVIVDHSHFNYDGVGVEAADYARVAVTNSESSGNQVGYLATSSSGASQLNIAQSTAANNSTAGVQATGSGAAAARVEGVSVFNNGAGFQTSGTGTITSFGNNYNTGAGTPTGTLGPQ
jgi:hypothetical protein